jgi:hypothetical protein
VEHLPQKKNVHVWSEIRSCDSSFLSVQVFVLLSPLIWWSSFKVLLKLNTFPCKPQLSFSSHAQKVHEEIYIENSSLTLLPLPTHMPKMAFS